MLKTVEEIEDEILKVLIAYEDEFVDVEERIDRIVEEGKKRLDDYEKELKEYYAEYEPGTYDEEFLTLYRQGKQNILESVKQLLDKETTGILSKIKYDHHTEASVDKA
jgi:sugar-specific transcriptional regulator TrmB